MLVFVDAATACRLSYALIFFFVADFRRNTKGEVIHVYLGWPESASEKNILLQSLHIEVKCNGGTYLCTTSLFSRNEPREDMNAHVLYSSRCMFVTRKLTCPANPCQNRLHFDVDASQTDQQQGRIAYVGRGALLEWSSLVN